MVYRMTTPFLTTAEPLFDGWEETLIWSCLQGMMGDVYADRPEHPCSAMAMIADFIFFVGAPREELVRYRPDDCTRDFMLMVPQNEEWSRLIERCYEGRSKRVTRYAIRKEPDVFDREKLELAAASLPPDCRILPIDERIWHLSRTPEMGWASDWTSAYPDYDTYYRLGFGFAVEKNGEIVAGASSYTRYREGIEIQIDTRQDHRRQGLAYACGARLILEALDRSLYPSWDAQNLASVGVAEKLGYRFDHEYPTYEIYGY